MHSPRPAKPRLKSDQHCRRRRPRGRCAGVHRGGGHQSRVSRRLQAKVRNLAKLCFFLQPPRALRIGCILHKPSRARDCHGWSRQLRTRSERGESTVLVAQDKQIDQRRIVEFLARSFSLSIDAVARLYEEERAKVSAGARITKFLPLLAIRNAQKRLRLSAKRKASQ